MHQFDLLGEVFGRQAIEQVPKAINPVNPRVVVVDVVKKRIVSKVCSRGVYENELKIVVEPVGHPQTLERGGDGLLKTAHTSSQKERTGQMKLNESLGPRHLALARVSVALLCKFEREAKSVQEHKRPLDSSVPFLAHHGRLAQVGEIKLRQIFRRNVEVIRPVCLKVDFIRPVGEASMVIIVASFGMLLCLLFIVEGADEAARAAPVSADDYEHLGG